MIDVQYFSDNKGYKAIVKIRYKASGYPEAKALRTVNFIAIRRFLEKCIFYKYGTLMKLKINGGSENKSKV